jgi:hypothetical protein
MEIKLHHLPLSLFSAQKQWRKTITGDANKRIRDHMKETPQVKMLDKVRVEKPYFKYNNCLSISCVSVLLHDGRGRHHLRRISHHEVGFVSLTLLFNSLIYFLSYCRHPTWFLTFYTWLMLLLFAARYILYKQSKYHFFMLDCE